MLASLADPILPIFAILAIGFMAGKKAWFDAEFARTLNRFVFYVAQPALVFFIVARAPFASFEWSALGVHFASQIIVYALGTLATRLIFKREWEEALLLGMTCAFVNHVFYVLPIAELIHGELAAKPIAGVIVIDIAILFCGTILILDVRRAGPSGAAQVARATARNPALLAILAGLGVNAAGPLAPPGLFTFADFVGSAAPPASLFALGLVMASFPLRPLGPATWTIVGIKVLIHPLLAFGLFTLAATPPDWRDILMLVAAGPCGAMPFVIALQYGVRTETIAKAILLSTVLTLLTLSVLTSWT